MKEEERYVKEKEKRKNKGKQRGKLGWKEVNKNWKNSVIKFLLKDKKVFIVTSETEICKGKIINLSHTSIFTPSYQVN